MDQILWTSTDQEDETFNIVHSHLTRLQLQEFLLLKAANPAVHANKLVAFLFIKKDNFSDPKVLESFGLNAPNRLNHMENAKIETSDRVALENQVLSYCSLLNLLVMG